VKGKLKFSLPIMSKINTLFLFHFLKQGKCGFFTGCRLFTPN